MSFPWVSRAQHNTTLAAADADTNTTIALLLGQLSTANKRYDDLLARYHMLKLQGFAEPAPERVIARPTIDPIMQAINAASAGKDHRVRAAMLAQVETDRADKMSDEAIIARIQRGNRPMEEVEV